MVLTQQQVKDLVLGLRAKGLDVGLRDVSFAVLSSVYCDDALAFRALFGDAPEVPADEYLASAKVAAVKEAIRPPEQEEGQEPGPAISFDDLKEGLIADMRALEDLRDSKDEEGRPALEPKEMAQVVGRIADIRVKLTEELTTTERVIEQRVVVEQKFDAVCPFCGREIAIGVQKKSAGTLF